MGRRRSRRRVATTRTSPSFSGTSSALSTASATWFDSSAVFLKSQEVLDRSVVLSPRRRPRATQAPGAPVLHVSGCAQRSRATFGFNFVCAGKRSRGAWRLNGFQRGEISGIAVRSVLGRGTRMGPAKSLRSGESLRNSRPGHGPTTSPQRYCRQVDEIRAADRTEIFAFRLDSSHPISRRVETASQGSLRTIGGIPCHRSAPALL